MKRLLGRINVAPFPRVRLVVARGERCRDRFAANAAVNDSSFAFFLRGIFQHPICYHLAVSILIFLTESLQESENVSFLSSTKATNYVRNISWKKIRQAGNYWCVYRKKSPSSPARFFRALHWPMFASIRKTISCLSRNACRDNNINVLVWMNCTVGRQTLNIFLN